MTRYFFARAPVSTAAKARRPLATKRSFAASVAGIVAGCRDSSVDHSRPLLPAKAAPPTVRWWQLNSTPASTAIIQRGRIEDPTATQANGGKPFAFPSIPVNNNSDVTFDSFTATSYPSGIELEWKTGYEVDNLGFNLYRDYGGQHLRLNSSIIAGSALLAGQQVALTAGQSYSCE